MNKNSLWSLRLGFSGKQSNLIQNMGLPKFLEQSYASKLDKNVPSFLNNSPKSIQELRAKRQALKSTSPEEAKELLKIELQVSQEMKAWWLEKMITEEFPLREK